MGHLKISAVICTYNRADRLPLAIKSLLAQNLSSEKYEILVVDNASTDGTAEMLRKEFLPNPSIHYIYEPVQGLSQARNTGWKNAEGEYVAYLDDDAIAESDWLEKILETFLSLSPNAGCVGGKIFPIWESERPSWLNDEMLGQLSVVDWGDKPFPLKQDQWLAGASIAFPRRLLQEVGGFSVEIGRKGRKLLSMEEVLIREEIEERGHPCFYNPKIIVRHYVPASRMTPRWFFERAYWQGVSDGLISLSRNKPAVQKFRKGASTLGRILLNPRELRLVCADPRTPAEIKQKCSVMARVGHAFSLWGLAK